MDLVESSPQQQLTPLPPGRSQGAANVPQSVLEAIKLGVWDFEPTDDKVDHIAPTAALPGSTEKIDVLAERLRLGLPLWHPRDRITYRDSDVEI
jgi:hypothetical protein